MHKNRDNNNLSKTEKNKRLWGIRGKILLVSVGFPILALTLVSLVTLRDFNKMSNLAQAENRALGEAAADESAQALRRQAEEDLLQLAIDQAAVSDSLFHRVESETQILLRFARDTWNRPLPQSVKPGFTRDKKPPENEISTVYKAMEGTRPEVVSKFLARSLQLDVLLAAITREDTNITQLYMGTPMGIIQIYPWLGRDKLKDDYDPRKRDWFRLAIQTKRMGWTSLYEDAWGSGLMVTCFVPFYNSKSELIGVFGADVTLKNLIQSIIGTQIGETGYAILVDETGFLVAGPNIAGHEEIRNIHFENRKLLNTAEPEIQHVIGRMINGETGVAECVINGKKKLLAFAPLQTQGWSLGIVKPIDEIVAPASQIATHINRITDEVTGHIRNMFRKSTRKSSAILILLGLLVIMLALRVANRLIRPIQKLRTSALRLGAGNLDHRISVMTGDEIQDLAESYNRMADDLKHYIQDLKETTAAKERMESELQIARQIQMSMIPRTFPAFPEREEFDIHASIEPARQVGGDFYDFFMLDQTRFLIAIGDVSDKGIPAALFMAASRSFLRSIARPDLEPSAIIKHLNTELCVNNSANMFVTIFIGIIDLATGKLQYTCGGHPAPIRLRKGSAPEELPGVNGPPAGAMDDSIWSEASAELELGDIIYIYTDGVSEAENRNRDMFSDERIMEILASRKYSNCEEVVDTIQSAISEFTNGAAPYDDITMLAFQYRQKLI